MKKQVDDNSFNKFAAWFDMLIKDHGFLRLCYNNFHKVNHNIYRSNMPTPMRIKKYSEIGIKTIVLVGNEGGKVKSISDCIIVPSLRTERVQECHILIGHIVCGLVEEKFFKNSSKTYKK